MKPSIKATKPSKTFLNTTQLLGLLENVVVVELQMKLLWTKKARAAADIRNKKFDSNRWAFTTVYEYVKDVSDIAVYLPLNDVLSNAFDHQNSFHINGSATHYNDLESITLR